jgi:hypothetical protein
VGDAYDRLVAGKCMNAVLLVTQRRTAIRMQGYYNFTFDAKTEDGKRIYCLTAEVCMEWEDEEKNKRYSQGPWGNCTWP